MELPAVKRHLEKRCLWHPQLMQRLPFLPVWRNDQQLGFFKTKTSKQEFEKERKLVEKHHLELETIAKKHTISFSSKIVKNGMASVKILEFSKQHGVDLIIMTKTKISSSYEKQHYQSTIENVFRNTHCPILIL